MSLMKQDPPKTAPTETFVSGPDLGFKSVKSSLIRVTPYENEDSLNFDKIFDEIFTTEFPSFYAPLPAHLKDYSQQATGRILLTPVAGMVGITAKELSSFWSISLSEEHYLRDIWQLYFWEQLFDLLCQSGIESGTHCRVFSTLGLPPNVMGYESLIQEKLIKDSPIYLSGYNHEKSFWVTLDPLEIRSQPFWVAIEQVMQVKNQQLVLDPSLLQGGLLILDFGSKTLSGLLLVNNLIPVQTITVAQGTWSLLQTLINDIDKIRQEKGLLTGIKWQELMPVYETKKLSLGQTELDLSSEINKLIQQKSSQRYLEIDSWLTSPVANMILAGGDAGNNFEIFKQHYTPRLSGTIKLAVDNNGKIEPVYRQRDGLLKGALRNWLVATRTKRTTK